MSLIEVLLVIAIIGITASVVMLSISGPSKSARTAECREDKATLRAAEDAHFERFGKYGTEDDLTSTKLLHEKSDRYHAVPAGDGQSYTLTPTGSCSP